MKYIYSNSDFKLADKFTACVLSMDELYKAKNSGGEASLSKEGLVPVQLSEFEYKKVGSWPEIKSVLKEVYRDYHGIENDIRKSYMLEQVSSVISLGEWVFDDKDFTYRQLVQNLLFLNHNPVSQKQIDRQKERLDILLSSKNYRGSFQEKLSAWKKDSLVDKKDLQSVMDYYMEELKRKTVGIGFSEIADTDVECVVDYDLPFSGYCDFISKKIIVNGDMEYTYPGVKRLLAHETHPGHMTHMQVRKTLYEQGKVPSDAILVITNTASGGIFEGLADNGLLFTGWDNGPDDEIARVYNNLSAMISVTMAHRIHEEQSSVDEVKQLFRDTLSSSETSVDSKIRFLTFPFRRPFTYCYWRGNEAVRRIYTETPKHEIWEFLRFAYMNMNSVNSLYQFI